MLVEETIATRVIAGAVMVVVSVSRMSTGEDHGPMIDDLRVVVAYLCKTDAQSFGPSLEGNRFRASSPSLIQGSVQVLAADVAFDVDLGAMGFAKTLLAKQAQNCEGGEERKLHFVCTRAIRLCEKRQVISCTQEIRVVVK